jgi:hypothetical protein
MPYSGRAAILGSIARMSHDQKITDQKITLGQIRQSGAFRLHVVCGDYKCGHSVVIDTDCWPNSLRLSDLEFLFVCTACGHRGAEVRPDFGRTRGSTSAKSTALPSSSSSRG